MKTFTIQNKCDGEMAVRGLSDKARKFYDGADIDVYGVYDYEREIYLYYVVFPGDNPGRGLTLEELNETLSEYQEQAEAAEKEWEE